MKDNPETHVAATERVKFAAYTLIGAAILSSLVGSEPYHQDDPPRRTAVRANENPLNVVSIVVDDMNDFPCAETGTYLPKSSKWLLDQGICFENATTTTPVCCPARSIIQTGQLAHNNGVMKQSDAENLRTENTVQHTLSTKNIATYATGKYLNGVDLQKVATGEMYTGFQEHDLWGDYDYRGFGAYDEEGNYFETSNEVHTTEQVGENIQNFIRDRAGSDKSFYIHAGYYAPHVQRQTGSEQSAFPQPTSQNQSAEVPKFVFEPEIDASDKLPIFQGSTNSETHIGKLQEARLRSLLDVDDQIAAMFETLESNDLLDTTSVFFMSDNGYTLGQHNWNGKAIPYTSSISIPMLAYIPTETTRATIDTRDVSLVDLAPTIYDLYNIEPGYAVDGYSLIGTYTRKHGQFYEFVNDNSDAVRKESGSSSLRVPSWQMYKRGNEAYVEYFDTDGTVLAQEFYDSPLQLENLLYVEFESRRPSKQKLTEFKQALYRARTCAGTTEVDSENPCL